MAFNYLTIYMISDFRSLDAVVIVWLVKLPRMYLCLCAQESPRENPCTVMMTKYLILALCL